MDINNIDKLTLKAVVKEILLEDSSIFKDIIKEILTENQVIISEEQQSRRKKLEKFIDEDFDNYDEVFKALA